MEHSKMSACEAAMDGMNMPCTMKDVVDVAIRRFGPMVSEYGNCIGVSDVRNALTFSKKYTRRMDGLIDYSKETGNG